MDLATARPAATVDDVLVTAEFDRRPARRPDYEAESRALGELAAVMADSPERVFQVLADAALRLCRAGSAGVSVWESGGPEDVFRWRAVAGQYASYRGGTLPRHFSPCGTVLDRRQPLIMADPVRFFPYIADLPAPAREVLLVPFHQDGVPVGTVWVVAHTAGEHFDPEDARLLTHLARFAGAAVQALARIEAAEAAGRALRASEARFRAIFEALDEGFCVVEPVFDAAGRAVDYRYLYANPALVRHTGLRDVVGKTAREVMPHHEAHWIEAYGRVATTGEPFRRTDRVADLGRWYEVSATRVGGPDGRQVGVLFADVTARWQAEQALRVSEQRLAEVFHHAPSFMAVLRGPDHLFERANDRYVRLVGGRELAGRPVREALPEVVGQGFIDLLDRVYQTGEPYIGTGTPVLLDPGGGRPPEERFLDFVYQPLRDAAGAVTGILVQGIDLTERRRAEEALREADRRKDDFLALLAHELRNPLAPLRNGLQVLRLAADGGTRDRARAVMERQLAHMVRLVDDLLDVSRISRNKMELRRDRVALGDVVGHAVETARPVIDAAGHELTVALPARPVFLDADLTRLSQVLSNLLTNSAKYTPRGGRIRLTGERSEAGVTVAVTDTGIGIPAAALSTVFDMFSQVDRTVERATGGLGIGLALVKGLVEMHGGTVTAASDGPGRGSTFTVTLPVLPDHTAPPSSPVTEPGASRSGRRVLVVDDNVDGAESLAEMLRLLGDDVRTSHDGLEAVAQAERFRPDVVLMDVGMPRLNGLEATRRIREQPWGRDMTIVALTGWGQDNDRERSRVAGCDGHLVKPVALTDLEAVLRGISPR